MPGSRLAFLIASFAVLFVAASSALAADPPAVTDLAKADHYCISCHSANDARLNKPLAWNGGVERAALSPCPTVRQLWQEMALTDDAFDAIRKGAGGFDAGTLARAESIARLLETDYRSVDAGVNEARQFRYQLNKSYAQLQTKRDAWNSNVIFVVGVVITLFLLGSLAQGYANTRRAQAPAARWLRIGPWSVLFILTMFIVFSLPIFNPPIQSETSTTADLVRQSALDAATRAATSAETLSAKGWQLARLAADTPAELRGQALTTALSATNELAINADAYWGRARALEESAVTWEKGTDAAVSLAQRIKVYASRAWVYAVMADELAASDPARARELLDAGLVRARRSADSYFRALDLKKTAVALSRFDRVQAVTVADEIDEPFIRAWALRVLGEYERAAAAAREVEPAYLRVYALREIGALTRNASLLEESLSVAQTLEEPARAYARADIAGVWKAFDVGRAAQVAGTISTGYPSARAVAFLQLGRYSDAWVELTKLSPGAEQARAQGELVAAYARVSPNEALGYASKINDPFWSATALRSVAGVLARSEPDRALGIARAISIPFVRMQALTDIAQATDNVSVYPEAAALADELHDPYPIRDLTVAWALLSPMEALALVDKMDREGARAQALLAVALALAPADRVQANVVYERAIKQAQGTRLRGDTLWSAELLRELGARYATVDAMQADKAWNASLDAAQKVSTAF